jgi:hypothetical protein
MKMKAKSGGGGGGISMNKNVTVGVRTGSPSKATSPAAANQLGAATAFKKEQVGVGRGERNSVPLGNEVALNVGKGGCGTGRDIHRYGSQGFHGPANPGHSPAARDILSEFGPDKRKG